MRKRETAKAVAFAIVTFFILWLRRPDSLLNAQFWAEDGGVFFREQVLFGFSGAFVRLYSGYAHVIPRIVMALACALPVRWVPLGVNFSALAIAALACSAFFWPCYRRILSSDALRAVCCLLMAASIVVGSELIGIISNVQWYLCILSLLLIMTIQERMEMWLTVAQVAIALSAPVTLLFVPVLLWQAWKNPARYKGRPVVHLASRTNPYSLSSHRLSSEALRSPAIQIVMECGLCGGGLLGHCPLGPRCRESILDIGRSPGLHGGALFPGRRMHIHFFSGAGNRYVCPLALREAFAVPARWSLCLGNHPQFLSETNGRLELERECRQN